MTRGLRGPSAEHVRRPLRWAAVCAGIGALVFALDLQTSRRLEASLEEGYTLDATVDAEYGGGATVVLHYLHPIVGRTTASAVRWDAPSPPAGSTIRVDVSRDDPTYAVLAGDRYQSDAWVLWAALATFTTATAGARAWSLRRIRTVAAAADAPSFRLFGVGRPAGRFRRGAIIDLYPLDSSPASTPLCTVPVLELGDVPLDGWAREIQVKGRPRPFGLVVPYDGRSVLWPSGRARATTGRTAFPGPDPVPRPIAAELAGITLRAPYGPWLLVGAAGLVASLVAVAAVTFTNLRAAQALERDGTEVVATVIDADGDSAVRVEYRLTSDGERREGSVPVDYPDEWPTGQRFPAVVDPERLERLRFLASPYDPVEPFVWWGAVAATLTAAGVAVVRRVAAGRSLMAGPWVPIEARERDLTTPVVKARLLRRTELFHLHARVPIGELRAASLPEGPGILYAAGALMPGRTVVIGRGEVAKPARVWPVSASPLAPLDG